MKIVVGMGSIDEYIPYAKAGADEVFCGYIPQYYGESFQADCPLNRREVLYYNVQVGSHSELVILRKMMDHVGVPVTITLNALYYQPAAYAMVLQIVRECMEVGFYSFIIADVALLVYLQKHLSMQDRKKIQIHLSGETAEVNSLMIEELCKLNCNRIIFHRQKSIDEMAEIINAVKMNCDRDMAFEAFAMNEKCHFTGAFCNSLHCDELTPVCRLPYRLYDETNNKVWSWEDDCYGTESETDCRRQERLTDASDKYAGSSGCALCAVERLQKAGITHLKVVSRGNYAEDTIEDIRALRQALDLIGKDVGRKSVKNSRQSMDENFRSRILRDVLQKERCSGNCYYYTD